MAWSLPMHEGDGISDGKNVDNNTTYADKGSVVVVMQRRLNDIKAVTPKIANDGKYGAKTSAAVIQVFGSSAYKEGRRLTGNQFQTITDKSNAAQHDNSTEINALEARIEALESATGTPEHDHDGVYSPTGHKHPVTVHSHKYSGTTEEA